MRLLAQVRMKPLKGERLCIVIDEVDCCELAIAHALLDGIQRYLSQSGSIVVFAYVEEQRRFEMFHPGTIGLP